MISILVALVTLTVASPFLLGWHHRTALERYKAELRASGRLKTLTEARPIPVLIELNGGPALSNLMDLIPPIPRQFQPAAGDRLAPGTRRVAWAETNLASDEVTNLWPGLRAFLGTNAAAIVWLHRILEAPVLSFNVRYEDGTEQSVALEELGPVRETGHTR